MKPSEVLTSNRGVIRRVVESHRARNVRVFGSVLHGQDTGSSDLDILFSQSRACGDGKIIPADGDLSAVQVPPGRGQH